MPKKSSDILVLTRTNAGHLEKRRASEAKATIEKQDKEIEDLRKQIPKVKP